MLLCLLQCIGHPLPHPLCSKDQPKMSLVPRLRNTALDSFLFIYKQNGTISLKTLKKKTIVAYTFSFKQWKMEVIFSFPQSQK